MEFMGSKNIIAHVDCTSKAIERVGYYYPNYKEYSDHRQVMIAEGWTCCGSNALSDACIYVEYEKVGKVVVEYY